MSLSPSLVFFHRWPLCFSLLYPMVVAHPWFGEWVNRDDSSEVTLLIIALMQWLVASIFVMSIGLAMADLASAAPTSGGVCDYPFHDGNLSIYNHQLYFWTFSLSSPRWRNIICWLVGCKHFHRLRLLCCVHCSCALLFLDANTVGMIAGVASVDWGCAVQIMAAATLGSKGAFQPTSAQLLWVILLLLPIHYFDVMTGLTLKAVFMWPSFSPMHSSVP